MKNYKHTTSPTPSKKHQTPHKKTVNPSLVELTTLLRTTGLKVTSGRIAVLQVLADNPVPLSITDIAAKLGRTKVDRVTLYRMLATFVGKGLARTVDLRHTHAHYELAIGPDHHHIICTHCSRIEDLPHYNLQQLIKTAIKNSSHFDTITDHSLELFGTCRKCEKETSKA